MALTKEELAPWPPRIANFECVIGITAFRRTGTSCHPDHGGTAEQFIELQKARDRLLAALDTKAAAPKMPEIRPEGTPVALPLLASWPLRHTRRLTG